MKTIEQANIEEFKIRYMDKLNNFRVKEIFFNTYEDAKQWGLKTLENFHLDMIIKNN